MAQQTLQGPDSDAVSLNTGSESAERGWSPKRILAAINTMFTELYLSKTTLEGQNGGATSLRADVTISSAELLALNATPKTLIAAPGAGLALVLERAVLYKPAGTAYAGIAAGEDLAIKYTDGSGAALATVETTGFLDQATAQVRAAEAYRAASGVNDFTPSNTPIVAHLLSGEITTGNSAVLVRVFYRVIPTVLS